MIIVLQVINLNLYFSNQHDLFLTNQNPECERKTCAWFNLVSSKHHRNVSAKINVEFFYCCFVFFHPHRNLMMARVLITQRSTSSLFILMCAGSLLLSAGAITRFTSQLYSSTNRWFLLFQAVFSISQINTLNVKCIHLFTCLGF